MFRLWLFALPAIFVVFFGSCNLLNNNPRSDAGLFNPVDEAVNDHKWMNETQLFVVDTSHHVIRVMDRSTEVISNFVGTGTGGTSANGTSIATAQVDRPVSLLALGEDHIVFSMPRAFCVQEIQNGVVQTIAGTCGTSGAITFNGLATDSLLDQCTGLCIDSAGDIYITDTGNAYIAKINRSTGILTKFAGNGTSVWDNTKDGGPATLAAAFTTDCTFDANDNLYFLGSNDHVVQKVTPAGIISTIAGDGTDGSTGDNGPATSARFLFPYGLAADHRNNLLYIADRGNAVIRKIDLNTGIITRVAGLVGYPGFNGDGLNGTSAQIYFPDGIAVRGDTVYFADGNNSRIRKISAAGVVSTVVGNGYRGNSGTGLATQAEIGYAYSSRLAEY